jgi:hypothetical protein
MNSEAMQKPVADKRTDDSNGCVADETEPAPSDNLASEPSGNDSDDQYDPIRPWSDRCMLSPLALPFDSRPARQQCKEFGLRTNAENRRAL